MPHIAHFSRPGESDPFMVYIFLRLMDGHDGNGDNDNKDDDDDDVKDDDDVDYGP